MKKLAILLLAVVMGLTTAAQTSKSAAPAASKNQIVQTNASKASTIQKVTIQTNGVCEKCEKLFKENVPYFKGVKDYAYDAKTAKMTITYDSKKTSPDQLRQQISKLGYNADNVKADPAARAKLPACCQVNKKPAQPAGCCGHSNCGHDHSKCSGNHSNCQGHQEKK